MNFPPKSGVCILKNEWVMINYAKWLNEEEGKVESVKYRATPAKKSKNYS